VTGNGLTLRDRTRMSECTPHAQASRWLRRAHRPPQPRGRRASKMEAEAARGWHREDVGKKTPSTEDKMLHRVDEESRQSAAEAELDALDASLGDNEDARRVLRCRREHELVKAREIAAKLGMKVEVVYRANEVLRDHLRAVRKRRDREKDDRDADRRGEENEDA